MRALSVVCIAGRAAAKHKNQRRREEDGQYQHTNEQKMKPLEHT
jgi:hypothetical protein